MNEMDKVALASYKCCLVTLISSWTAKTGGSNACLHGFNASGCLQKEEEWPRNGVLQINKNTWALFD